MDVIKGCKFGGAEAVGLKSAVGCLAALYQCLKCKKLEVESEQEIKY